MAVNLDLIRKKLDSFQGKNKLSDKFWKPQPGKQEIRIVPYKYNLENPFIELRFYYYPTVNGAIKTFLSPDVVGDPDPVLEFCEKLRSTGTKENWVLSKKYEPKLRTYVPIIVRDQEELGVRFWGFGKTVYEELLRKMSNPDYGDITDLQEGHDVIVEFIKNSPAKKSFPETKIDIRVKKTPAVDPNNEKLVKLLMEQDDILKLFTVPSYEVLETEFKKYINPDNDDISDPEDALLYGNDKDEKNVSDGGDNEGSKTVESEVVDDDILNIDVKVPSEKKGELIIDKDGTKEKLRKMFTEALKTK
jgi:hypothetical protein